MTATIFDIQRGSFVDGPGIRTAVFFKGCNLKCKWCHNPESRSANPEIMFYKDKCTHCGRCGGITANDDNFICFNGAKRICGKLYTVDEVFAQIEKDKTYYENSGRAEIIIRIPVIGGYNDNTDEMRRIADFLKGIKYSRAELLPYHALGEHKYDALGLKTEKFYVPDKALTEEYKKFF